MYERNKDLNIKNVKLMDIDSSCARYSCGKTTMRAMAAKANAVVRIGRLWRCNVDVMDAYFDKTTE